MLHVFFTNTLCIAEGFSPLVAAAALAVPPLFVTVTGMATIDEPSRPLHCSCCMALTTVTGVLSRVIVGDFPKAFVTVRGVVELTRVNWGALATTDEPQIDLTTVMGPVELRTVMSWGLTTFWSWTDGAATSELFVTIIFAMLFVAAAGITGIAFSHEAGREESSSSSEVPLGHDGAGVVTKRSAEGVDIPTEELDSNEDRCNGLRVSFGHFGGLLTETNTHVSVI